MAKYRQGAVGKPSRQVCDGDGVVADINMKRHSLSTGRDMFKDIIVRDTDYNPEHNTRKGRLQEDKGTACECDGSYGRR